MTPDEEKKLKERVAELELQIALNPPRKTKKREVYYFELSLSDTHNIKDALKGAMGYVEANFMGASLKGKDLAETIERFGSQFTIQILSGDKKSHHRVNGATSAAVHRARTICGEKKHGSNA